MQKTDFMQVDKVVVGRPQGCCKIDAMTQIKTWFFICVMLVFSLLLAGGEQLQAQNAVLYNPVLKGFYPDPSIIRVDKNDQPNYYLVNSTFAYFPGIPVFHSTDMVQWAQIGNVINRPSQMNFLGARLTRGLFAPAISYYKGLFYLVCTQIDRGGNFVVTAKDPAGPWSDPVYLPEVKGIDPSLYFDSEKDAAYIVYNGDPEGAPLYDGHRAIRMFRFDYHQLKVTGANTVLVNGGVDITKKPVWIEGPHIMKRNGWYYLYAAEGGTSVNHSEVVFRSRSLNEPFVPYKNNPILTQKGLPKDRSNPITSAGHAQFVEGPDGRTYAFFLAVRPYDKDYYNTGRETFVAPVKWQNDWPIVQTGTGGVQYQYPTDLAAKGASNAVPLNGNFTLVDRFDRKLDLSYLFMRTQDNSSFKVQADKGSGLRLRLRPETVMGYQNPSFIGRRQQHLTGSYTAQMLFTTDKAREKAGITIFQNERHFYYLCKSVSEKTGKPVIQLYQPDSTGENMSLLAEAELSNEKDFKPAAAVQLKIQMNKGYYSFSYKSAGANRWQSLKDSVDARPLSTHIAGGFIGCLFGMYAISQGNPTENTVLYNWTKYVGADKMD